MPYADGVTIMCLINKILVFLIPNKKEQKENLIIENIDSINSEALFSRKEDFRDRMIVMEKKHHRSY